MEEKNTLAPAEKATRAIRYTLNRSLHNNDLYHQIGWGTEVFRLLTEALAALTGENVNDIERKYTPE